MRDTVQKWKRAKVERWRQEAVDAKGSVKVEK